MTETLPPVYDKWETATLKLCGALKVLRATIDAFAIDRNRASDGTIGDAAHAARQSDHNPALYMGTEYVCALDITHDPNYLHGDWLAQSLQIGRDSRIKYVIWDHQIMSSMGLAPWQWTAYTGPDPHTSHVHISVLLNEETAIRRTPPWNLPTLHAFATRPRLAIGSTGDDVKALQRILNVIVDGEFGPITDHAVKTFQMHTHIPVDGIVGPITWATLRTVYR